MVHHRIPSIFQCLAQSHENSSHQGNQHFQLDKSIVRPHPTYYLTQVTILFFLKCLLLLASAISLIFFLLQRIFLLHLLAPLPLSDIWRTPGLSPSFSPLVIAFNPMVLNTIWMSRLQNLCGSCSLVYLIAESTLLVIHQMVFQINLQQHG